MKPTNLPFHPSANVPADYYSKLRSGIARLRGKFQALYERKYPESRDRVQRAVAEAEESAWNTPFPSLFFWPLAEARLHSALGMSATASA